MTGAGTWAGTHASRALPRAPVLIAVQPALFFAWLYVMTLPPMSALTYYLVLVAVGWYTSGLGFLISLLFAPRVTLLAGLAVALLLGGVANGVAPRLWQLSGAHPLAWLDQLSYTRCAERGQQAAA